MVGASTDIVNKGTLPAIPFRPYKCDTWTITNIYDGTIRVHAEVSHYRYDLGEQQKCKTMSHSRPNWPKVSLSTSTYALDYTYKIVCNTCHKQLAMFLLQQKVFMQAWLNKGFFSSK